MKNKSFDIFLLIAGILLLAAGIVFLMIDNAHGNLALPFILFGVGCGVLGHSIGNILSRKAGQKNPEIQKQLEIEIKDERNIELSNCAKAKAFDMMIYIIGVLLLIYALIGIEPIGLILLAIAYISVICIFVFKLNKLHKEM